MRTRLPALLALATATLVTAPAGGQSPGDDKQRQAFNAAFDQLAVRNAPPPARKKGQPVAAAGLGKVAPAAVATGVGTGKNAVKVCAELIRAVVVGGKVVRYEDTGRFVDIDAYRWQPGEYYRVHVQSVLPVEVYLYNGVGPAAEIFKGTNAVPMPLCRVVPGAVQELGVAFQTDDHAKPEPVELRMLFEPVPGAVQGKVGGGAAMLGRVASQPAGATNDGPDRRTRDTVTRDNLDRVLKPFLLADENGRVVVTFNK